MFEKWFRVEGFHAWATRPRPLPCMVVMKLTPFEPVALGLQVRVKNTFASPDIPTGDVGTGI